MEDPVAQILDEFKKVPDWYLFPLPEVVYQKYGIKKPKPVEIGDALWYRPPPADYAKPEFRSAAPGGVREVPLLESIPVETVALPDQETLTQLEDSKEPNETKSQESEAPSSSNPPEQHDVSNTTSSEPHPDVS